MWIDADGRPRRSTQPASSGDSLLSRREMLGRAGTGLGLMGLAGVMADARLLSSAAAAESSTERSPAGYVNPLLPKQPHFAAKAKRVIHLYMNGGPSQVDTFDPKPLLAKYAGQALPRTNLRTERPTGAAFPSPFKFKKYGDCGLEVSEIFQNTARHMDDIAVIRSMYADVPNHEPSMLLMNCGESRLVRPSM